MNERLKQIRNALGLSGEKFGERIGISRFAISQIETGRNGLSEQNIRAICREFNVNEEWLRTGEGEMFNPTDSISLDEFAKMHRADPLEIDILKAYFSIDKDIRKQVLDHFVSTLKKDSDGE